MRLVVVASLLGLMACVGVTDERARRDEDVGKASAAGAVVEVADGLASVRGLDPGALWLWAQAPALRVRVRTSAGAATSWTVTIDNTLPDATLEAAAGDALTVTALASSFRPASMRRSPFVRPPNQARDGASPW